MQPAGLFQPALDAVTHYRATHFLRHGITDTGNVFDGMIIGAFACNQQKKRCAITIGAIVKREEIPAVSNGWRLGQQ